MEASQAMLQRRLMLSLARSFPRCTFSSPSPLPLPLQCPAARPQSVRCQRLPSSQPFSSSRQWRQDEQQQSASEPSVASSRPETSKQALQSYIAAVNTIIDGFKLKESLSSRQHEQLVVALTNAETRVGAPHAHPDSFTPLLDSLKGEIDPILRRRFGTTDIRSLRSEALVKRAAESSKTIASTTPTVSAAAETSSETASLASPNSTTASTATATATSAALASAATATTAASAATATATSERSISQDLDAVFGQPPKRTSQEAVPSNESRETVNKWAALLHNPLSGINADLSAGTGASARARSPLAGASLSDYLNRRTAAERRESLDLNARLSAAEANADAQFRANYPSLNTNLSVSGQARDGLRLKPSLGRTVETSAIQSGDLTRAFRSLEALCKRNNVSYDFNRQRFHVRRGQRKKDVRIQRWRKQFSAGFLEECKRIRRMRAQGW